MFTLISRCQRGLGQSLCEHLRDKHKESQAATLTITDFVT